MFHDNTELTRPLHVDRIFNAISLFYAVYTGVKILGYFLQWFVGKFVILLFIILTSEVKFCIIMFSHA